jgi:hypothetical protein
VAGATSITSTTFTGDLTGDVTGNADTATTATTATNADNIDIDSTATNATHRITFVDSAGTSYEKLYVDSSGLTYNPSTNILTAGTFSGSGASLTNLNASNISTGTISDARLPASITSDITGNAATATTATNSTNINQTSTDGNSGDTTCFPALFVASGVGQKPLHIDSAGLTYNASTNVLNASGGITFSGQTDASGTGITSGVDLLDHYEEGSWTPILGDPFGNSGQFLDSSSTYTTQVGYYTRIGRLVHVCFQIHPSALGGGAWANTVGTAIGGLPFTCTANASAENWGVLAINASTATDADSDLRYFEPSTAYGFYNSSSILDGLGPAYYVGVPTDRNDCRLWQNIAQSTVSGVGIGVTSLFWKNLGTDLILRGSLQYFTDD